MQVPLPDAVQIMVNTTLQDMSTETGYRLTPSWRQQLYAAFGPLSNPLSYRARAWLGIITAQRVLPIFQQLHPNDEMPARLVGLAEAVARGMVAPDSPEVHSAIAESYRKMSGPWLATMPWSAHLAAYATRKALLEACGFEPLADLDESVIYGADDEAIPGRQWSDEQLCSDEIGDTASAAAAAS